MLEGKGEHVGFKMDGMDEQNYVRGAEPLYYFSEKYLQQ
jgi:hypothetical protein